MREWCKTIFCSLLNWYPLYKTVYYALIFDVYRSCFKSDFDSKVLTNAKKTIKTELYNFDFKRHSVLYFQCMRMVRQQKNIQVSLK